MQGPLYVEEPLLAHAFGDACDANVFIKRSVQPLTGKLVVSTQHENAHEFSQIIQARSKAVLIFLLGIRASLYYNMSQDVFIQNRADDFVWRLA